VLLNIALHGMEQAAGVRYQTTGSNAVWTVTDSPVLISRSGSCSRAAAIGQDHGTQVVLLGRHERDDTAQAPESVTDAR
jgi:hypothetical protein